MSRTLRLLAPVRQQAAATSISVKKARRRNRRPRPGPAPAPRHVPAARATELANTKLDGPYGVGHGVHSDVREPPYANAAVADGHLATELSRCGHCRAAAPAARRCAARPAVGARGTAPACSGTAPVSYTHLR